MFQAGGADVVIVSDFRQGRGAQTEPRRFCVGLPAMLKMFGLPSEKCRSGCGRYRRCRKEEEAQGSQKATQSQLEKAARRTDAGNDPGEELDTVSEEIAREEERGKQTGGAF